MVVGPFQRQRPEQRGEGLRAAAGVARRLAADARYRRTRMVGIVRVAGLRHRFGGEVEGLATDGLLKGLEVLCVDALRPPERIDFGRDCGYERGAPTPLATRAAAASARRYTVPLEGLEVLRIHPSLSQDSLDVGLDGRLQRGEHLLVGAPFLSRGIERFRQRRLGHGRSPPTRDIGRSALA